MSSLPPCTYFLFSNLSFTILFHLRTSSLVDSKSLKVSCKVVYVIVVVFSSIGSSDGILVGLGDSSTFTMEEEIGVISLGVTWDLVLTLLYNFPLSL